MIAIAGPTGGACGTLRAMRMPRSMGLTLLLVIVPAGASAGPDAPGIVGGTSVPAGTWRDAAGVLFGGELGCSGVLVAPRVVLTAGHCDDPSIDSVLLGAHSLASPDDGETVPVLDRRLYPNWEDTFDVTALVLARDATIAPRPLATGWAQFELTTGATVTAVGFGAIDRQGTAYVDALQAVDMPILDPVCADPGRGCNPGAGPAGELLAGGDGRDSCNGDSGGPLYVAIDDDAYLAGLTSRGTLDGIDPCGDGGIYVRADAIVAWLEAEVGPVAQGPAPTASAIIIDGDLGLTRIEANDPRAQAHGFTIVAPPAYGRATVSSTGTLAVCSDADFTGDDTLTIAVEDSTQPTRRLTVTVPIQVNASSPVSCEPIAPDEPGGCGCASSSPPPPAGWLLCVAGVMLGLTRRRSRPREPVRRTNSA